MMNIPMMIDSVGATWRTLAVRELEPRGGQERWQVLAQLNLDSGDDGDLYRTTYYPLPKGYDPFGGWRWEAPTSFLHDMEYWEIKQDQGWEVTDPTLRSVIHEHGN